MHGANKKLFHEWANTIPFDKLLEEIELCRGGVECLHCECTGKVYYVEWNHDCDFYCANCLKEFLSNEIAPSSNGSLRKRFLIFSRDDFKCVYCGRNPRDHNTTLEIEHVHPKSKGGTDSLSNLVTACKECNAGKGDLLLDMRQKKKFIDRS